MLENIGYYFGKGGVATLLLLIVSWAITVLLAAPLDRAGLAPWDIEKGKDGPLTAWGLVVMFSLVVWIFIGAVTVVTIFGWLLTIIQL